MRRSVIVVGGGIGGLTTAALLSKTHDVMLFEASNEWGGCAGKFTRGPFTYPVGATLGMGFEQGGIHEKIGQILDVEFQAERLDHVMKVYMPNDAPIIVEQNRAKHLLQLVELFPSYARSIELFFQEVWTVAKEIQYFMQEMPVMPPKNSAQWLHLMKAAKPSSLSLAPYMTKTMKSLVDKHGLASCQSFQTYLNGQLIDSMQTTIDECSALIGCLALDLYHTGAFYVEGGLFQVAEKLAAKVPQGQAKLRTPITKAYPIGDQWAVEDRKGQRYVADHIVWNIPLSNIKEIIGESLFQRLGLRYVKREKAHMWGTFTLYLAVEERVVDEPYLFYQVMSSDEMDEGEHIFISVSKEGDVKRAPVGSRTITVSTHSDVKKWKNLSKEAYRAQKAIYMDKLLSQVRRVFSQIDGGIIEMHGGSPLTWERYTRRKDGIVGGYAQKNNQILLQALSHQTALKNVWLCGDSVFPGASTVSVSMNGYHVANSIQQMDLRK